MGRVRFSADGCSRNLLGLLLTGRTLPVPFLLSSCFCDFFEAELPGRALREYSAVKTGVIR